MVSTSEGRAGLAPGTLGDLVKNRSNPQTQNRKISLLPWLRKPRVEGRLLRNRKSEKSLTGSST